MMPHLTASKRMTLFSSRRTGQQILVWILAEITLTLVGLDDLADYSEYVFKAEARQELPVITIVR